MRNSVAVALLATLASAAVAGAFVACGNDGARGELGPTGPVGPAGTTGPQGPPGEAGAPGLTTDGGVFSGACTKPCHTFNGVVDQWRFSSHSHPQENEVGGGVCGNCHAVDGLQQRLANNVTVTGDSGAPTGVAQGHINYRTSTGSIAEAAYGGASTVGRIHCSTCHDFNSQTDPHVTGAYLAGQAPIRVPGAASDVALIEKSDAGSANPVGTSVGYKAGNVCVFCHKSRKDISFYINSAPDAGNTLSVRWGPHEGPVTDVYSGKGGYHFSGKTYGTSAHSTIPNGCVDCHMQPVAGNANVPDHSMKPTVAFCKTCHTTYAGTSFDIQGGRTIVRGLLLELQAALNNLGMLTRSTTAPYTTLDSDQLADAQFQLDKPRSPGAGVSGERAGALYNYLIVARGKDLGVHNPTYTKQLLFDSIQLLTGSVPTTLPTRPN